MTRFTLRTALLVAGGLLAGCAALPANPRTEIGTWSWKFHNSKDVSIKLAEAGFNPETKEASLKGLEITDNASAVRAVNVQQMLAMAEEIRAQGEAWDKVMARANEALTGVLSALPGLYAARSQAEIARDEARFQRLELLLEQFVALQSPKAMTAAPVAHPSTETPQDVAGPPIPDELLTPRIPAADPSTEPPAP